MIKFKNILNWNLVICFVLSIWGLDLNAQHKIINSGWQYSEDKASWQTINIPHTWNLKDAFDDTPLPLWILFDMPTVPDRLPAAIRDELQRLIAVRCYDVIHQRDTMSVKEQQQIMFE